MPHLRVSKFYKRRGCLLEEIRYVLYFVRVWKRMVVFFVSVCFAFFTGLPLPILYKQLSCSFQLSKKWSFVFSISMFLWYRIDHLSQFLRSLKFKPNSTPTHTIILALCYRRLKRRFFKLTNSRKIKVVQT